MTTPNGPQFRTIFKGYDPQQVDLAITDLNQQVAKAQSLVNSMEQSAKMQQARAISAEKDIASLTAELKAETERRRQLEEASTKPWAALGEFAQKTQDEANTQAANIIKEAQSKANQMIEAATSRANGIVNEAQAKADRQTSDTNRDCEQRVRAAQEQATSIIESAKATSQELYEKTDRETKEQVRKATEEADRQVKRAQDATEQYRGIAQMVDSLYRICIDRDGAPVMKPAAPKPPQPVKPTVSRPVARPAAAPVRPVSKPAPATSPTRKADDPEATIVMAPIAVQKPNPAGDAR